MSIREMNASRMAMLLFISSEALFFGSLIITYINYRSGPGSAGAAYLNVPLTLLFSVALFASSATIAVAHRQLDRGDRRGLRFWLLATIVLGLVFLAGQAWEYGQLLREGLDLAAGSFGSAFYGLTGFHGLHVAAGLALLALLWAVAPSPAFVRRGGTAFEAVSLYWHFVDAVWVVVLTVVYLWGWL